MASNTPLPNAAGPPKLVNMYYVRQVGTAKPCFICNKETTVCLANQEVTDFLYTCQSHLLDPGFARPVVTGSSSSPSSPKPGSSTPVSNTGQPPTSPSSTVAREEIDKAISEHKDKQSRKTTAATSDSTSSSTGSNSSNVASTATSLFKTGLSAMSSLASTTSSTLFPAAPPQVPSASETMRQQARDAKVFTLHRDIFKIRQDKLKNEWYKKDAKERAKGLSLPSVPTGLPGRGV